MGVSQKTGQIVVGAMAAITSTVVGSFFGDQGTLIGTGLGAITSGAAAETYKWLGQKGRYHVVDKIPQHVARIGMYSAVGLAATGMGVYTVEASTGKPLHAITTGAHEKGSSFDHTPSSYSPTPTVPHYTPIPTGSYSTGTSFSPSISPSPTSVLPTTVSPTPSLFPTGNSGSTSGSSSTSSPTAFPIPATTGGSNNG